MIEPKCPACGKDMRKVIPLMFQGEGVDTFQCMNPDCEYEVRLNLKLREIQCTA